MIRGGLVLLGLFTRFAALPLIRIMVVALATTKVPILMESGFREMAHETRTDWSMLVGSVFLLIVGAGRGSLDARLAKASGAELSTETSMSVRSSLSKRGSDV